MPEYYVKIVRPSTKWGLIDGEINLKIRQLTQDGFETVDVEIFQDTTGPHALIKSRKIVKTKETGDGEEVGV